MRQDHPKIKDRPKTSCFFYGRTRQQPYGATLCTLTTYEECKPDTCPWYKTREDMDRSYEKARQNYIKKYGKDEYYEKGYGPKMRQNPRKKEEEYARNH